PDSLFLLFQPGLPIEFLDKRWEHLTGLSKDDLANLPSDVVLDWLFPHQRDREFVADLLHQPERRGAHAALEVVVRDGSRGMLCTFLPLPAEVQPRGLLGLRSGLRAGPQPIGTWLLLVSELPLPASQDTAVQLFLCQCTRGLGQLLNDCLGVPMGLA